MTNYRRITAISLAIGCLTMAGSLASLDSSAALAKKSHPPARRHIYRGRISRTVVAADQLLIRGKYAQAADFYRAALSKDSGDVNAAVGLGMALGKQFKLDGADEQFERVLAKDPGNPGAHSGKAMVMLNALH